LAEVEHARHRTAEAIMFAQQAIVALPLNTPDRVQLAMLLSTLPGTELRR
jgi:hypothetical protein